ncbi:MAG: ATP synthase F0 subunit B [Candidatus Sulfotelmatobacter sp.]
MISNMNSVGKIARVSLPALLIVSFAMAAGPLRAQQQPAAPPKQQQSNDSGKQPGFGQQLARETREAAGEDKEDAEKGEFKRSPSVQAIAKKLGISVETASLLSFLFNFAVIAGIIIWATRKYLPGAFSARTAAIQKAMQEAQKASEEARRKLAEIESRLMKLDVEIGMMRDAAEKEAEAEESRIQAAAQNDARKMLESATQEIAAAAKAARRELTAYAADLAVGLAQKQIHVDAATDRSLVRNFAGQLGASSGSAADAPGKGRS